MTKLTQKKVKFEWGDKQEAAFQLLKQKLCSAPILALPEGSKDFIAYCDASKKGFGRYLNAQTEARKPENSKSEDVGGMLSVNAKFPEAFRGNKSWNPRRWNPMPQWLKWPNIKAIRIVGTYSKITCLDVVNNFTMDFVTKLPIDVEMIDTKLGGSLNVSLNTMADAEHAPTMAPPVCTDEQIYLDRWVPIGKAGSYKCQLDDQWFDLTQDTLIDALRITPVDKNRVFSPPPTPNTLIKFVNELGYPREVINLSNVTTNDMFQPWRALATIINLCLTGKTSGFERPRAPVLHILWGVVNRAHIDYGERMWEEFTQSIYNFTKDKRNLAQQALKGKTESGDYHSDPKEERKPVSESSDAPPLAKRAKAGKVVKKRTAKSSKQLVDEFIDEGVPTAKPSLEDTEEAILQKVLEESLTDAYPTQRGPLPPVVFREHNTGKLQPLPEVPEKGKEKRHTPVPSEPAGHEESSSLYAELGLYGSDTEYDEEMPSMVRSGTQDEAKLDQGTCVLAGPNLEHSDVEIINPSSQPQPEHIDEGFTAEAYPDVQENLKLTVDEQVIPKEPVSSIGTLSSLQHLAKDFSFGDQFLNDKRLRLTTGKTTADTRLPPTPRIQWCLVICLAQDTHSSIYDEIDRKINELVKEVVISSVKHAMRAPLRARFKDLPTSDMKEILLQRIYGSGGTKKKVNKILKLLRPWVSIFTTTSSPTTVRRIQGIWHNTRASEFCSSSYLTSSVIIHSFGRSVNKLRGSKTPILLLQVQLELSWWENLSLKSDRSLQDLLGLFHHLSEPCQQTRASALKSYICTCTEKNLNCSHRGYGDVFMDWYCKRQGITHLVQKSEATSMGGELAIITIQPDYFFIKRSGVSYDMVARDEQQDFRQKKDVGQSRSSCSHYPETAKDTTYLPESGEALLVDGFEKATTGDLLKLNVLAPPYCATLFRISLHQFIKGEKIGTCSLDSPDAGGITQDNPLKILRVLRIILVVLPEHLSDTKVLTMKMEILLEPHQLALEFLLKMNLPDHRSVLTDPEDQAKMEMETPHSSGVNSPPNAHT
ncbi:retrovirus-related pol polyprotein from transposon TNT 1-94 [Tanacetum coccineum]